MKGIILAGGFGTRFFPATLPVVKQLLPVYDKPMIYYPLSTLMSAGIRDILIISTPNDIVVFEKMLGNGEQLGIHISYAIQEAPKGLAEAFIIGESFIGNDSVCLILGDNIFYGQNLVGILQQAKTQLNGACVFAYPVTNPKDFGICHFDASGKLIDIEEKPDFPKSNYAVSGLYFYDNSVVDIAKSVQPSSRGELEITAVNNEYIRQNRMDVTLLGRGIAWFDTGNAYALLKAAEFVENIQSRQGTYIACIEEVAWQQGFISTHQLYTLGLKMQKSDYGKYILELAGDT